MTEPQALEDTQGYQKSAYRADAIPPLPSPKRRRERSLDELLPFGAYAGIDPYLRLCEDIEAVQQQDRQDKDFYEKERWWDHHRIRFINEKMGLMILLMAVPYLWFLALIPGGGILSIAATSEFLPYEIAAPLFVIAIIITMFSWFLLGCYIYAKTIQWIMNGLGWLLMPFEKLINRKLDKSFAEGSSEFNRHTGKVSFAQGKHKPPFEAPFVEFDAYAERIVQPGGMFYRLMFVHRYTGKTFSRMWLHGITDDLTEVYAFWDMLQRYMDVSLPLPDIPRLEPFRDHDPVTAEFDRERKRDPRFWRDLDLEAWKQGAGAELSRQQQSFPWQQLRCRLTPQLGRIEMEEYLATSNAQPEPA